MSTPFLVVKVFCTFIGFMAIGYVIKLAADLKFTSKIDCHSTFPGVIERLSTHTPYIPPTDSALVEPYHLKVLEFISKGCKAEQIWFMARHGTRNPSDKIIKQMKIILPRLQEEILAANSTELCNQTLADIAAWKVYPGLDESVEEILTPQGKIELSGLGLRFKKRFPSLFDHKYDISTYKFKFTKTERAEKSAKEFVTSIFGEEGEKNVSYPEALDADPVLRFYKSCKRWKQQVDKNPDAQKEKKLFEESKYFKFISQNIQRRLGLKRNLTLEEIELMYKTCGFESSWNWNTTQKLSPWCGVFDERDLKVLEYGDDLEYYWGHGYGYPVNYEQACSPVKNFVDEFQARIDDPEHTVTPSVIAYFSHSGAQLKFLSRLGFFKDEQILRSDNYLNQRDRKWRTSYIDKFATNIAFLLHKCDEDYVISAFFQEIPIKIPHCDNWYCKFSDYKSKMSDIVDNCDLPSLCKI